MTNRRGHYCRQPTQPRFEASGGVLSCRRHLHYALEPRPVVELKPGWPSGQGAKADQGGAKP